MTATFRIIIQLALLVYLSIIMASYTGVASISCASAEVTGMCRCAVKTEARFVCYCQHMNHKGDTGPGAVSSLRLAQSGVNLTVLGRYCSCGNVETAVLPGLDKSDHLRSGIHHDVMWDEEYFHVPCDPILHGRAVDPPDPPPQ
jgi:hypothetical protein